jgi:glycosyltransferase involved in cell wall biosynthesis
VSDSRPRALLIGPLPPPMGGVGVLVQAIVESPLAERWRIEVFNLSKPQQEGRPSTVTPWDVAWTLVHMIQLPLRILARRPRVALVQSTADTGYVRDLALIMICRLLRVPVVIHWHGTPDSTAFPGHGLARTLFDFGVALAARFIVLAESYRDYFAAVVPAAKLAVVPNFVDGRRWARGSAPAPAAVAPGPLRLLAVGRIGPAKGTDVLLDALTLLAARGVATTATLVGAGESNVAFASARAHPVVVQGLAHLAGVLGDERAGEYRRADVFLQPTRADSFPIAILEAMAAGLPVVASSVGAIPWMLGKGECGVLVPPGDAGALADAIADLAASPARRAALGAAARARQQRDFDAAGAATALDRILVEAVGR